MTNRAEGIVLADQPGAYEMCICKAIGDDLERHYPGWEWQISVPRKQGVIQIRSGHMDPRWGFTLKLSTTYSATQLTAKAMRAGGEMLERAGMPRSRFDWDRQRAARNQNYFGFLLFQRDETPAEKLARRAQAALPATNR